MPLTVGGGIREIEDIRDLLNAGADKVSINTAAVQHPDFVRTAAERFGSQCIVVAIDAQTRAPPERAAALGGLHPRRPHADRARRGRVGAPHGATAPARSCSPAWTATAPRTATTSS